MKDEREERKGTTTSSWTKPKQPNTKHEGRTLETSGESKVRQAKDGRGGMRKGGWSLARGNASCHRFALRHATNGGKASWVLLDARRLCPYHSHVANVGT